MASKTQWIEAIEQAKKLTDNLKGQKVNVTNYIEDFDHPINYLCQVIRVNPFESFEDRNKFDFYVVINSIEGHENYTEAFLLDKIKDFLK